MEKKESKKMIVVLIDESSITCTEEEFCKNEIGCTIFQDHKSTNIPWTSVLWYRIDD